MNSRPSSASTCNTFGSRCTLKLKDYSINPKVSLYRTDGTGRDTYIHDNNGGYCTVGSTKARKIYSIKNESGKATNINPKFAIYKSDGYGRDQYIVSTCGGFYQGNHVKFFPTTLRSYDGFSTYKKYDYLHYANNYQQPTFVKKSTIKSRQQRALSARLSRPKYTS